MNRVPMNNGWLFYKTGKKADAKEVTLPHDAMLAEPRTENSAGGANISWFEGGDYTYEKNIVWPDDAGTNPTDRVMVEFEGIYQNAEIFLNNEKITSHLYGYNGFYADMTGKLHSGNNLLRVEVKNSNQPNSRWYTGSGIYRPVYLCLMPEKHIVPDSLKIRTMDYLQPCVSVSFETSHTLKARVEILQNGKVLYTAEAECDKSASVTIPMPGASIWMPESPVLYQCRVYCGEDKEEADFGIRVVECDAAQGLRINGKHVILRGACIHHDNGVIGAVAEPYAEERKVRLLQKAGYNALRSAHNPCSKALLAACDKLGMLVMDEYADMWYIHKTKYDYATHLENCWPQDLEDMVKKDYNHPCVIMYSIGNEVSETGQKKGIALTKKMQDYLHQLDDTRFVTCGINIFFNYLSSMGFGVYSDKKAEKTEIKPGKKRNTVGSEFFNDLAGLMGAGFMKFGATLHGSNVKTRDAFNILDVAGYNYGINRYEHDFHQYPDRVIVGTETFCADAYRFWETAKNHPALIGDFVWAGMDYLGEAGIGAWEFESYAPDFNHGPGWITAGSGRISITGQENGEALYTRVAFEQQKLGLAVVPVCNKKEKHSPSAWKHTNAIPSWSWNGMAGSKATVEVFTRAPRVALYINGEKVAEKTQRHGCRVVFHTIYKDGELEARTYDEAGKQLDTAKLKTAGNETILRLESETQETRDGELVYVHLLYTDNEGERKPLARGRVEVQVQNGTLLGLGNGCSYNEGSYLDTVTDTYYGEALAVIRPDGKGDVNVTAQSPFGNAKTTIPFRK